MFGRSTANGAAVEESGLAGVYAPGGLLSFRVRPVECVSAESCIVHELPSNFHLLALAALAAVGREVANLSNYVLALFEFDPLAIVLVVLRVRIDRFEIVEGWRLLSCHAVEKTGRGYLASDIAGVEVKTK